MNSERLTATSTPFANNYWELAGNQASTITHYTEQLGNAWLKNASASNKKFSTDTYYIKLTDKECCIEQLSAIDQELSLSLAQNPDSPTAVIMEISCSLEQLTVIKSTDQENLCERLLNLIQKADLLLANTKHLALLTESCFAIDNSLEENLAIKHKHSLNALLLTLSTDTDCSNSPQATDYLFIDSFTQAVLSPSQREATSNTTPLAAFIACFFLLDKRCCDAIILALALQSQLHCQPLSWPCDLTLMPQIRSAINWPTQQGFAKTDTLSLGLYPVVDSLEWLQKLLEIGIKTIQLRVKNVNHETLDEMVRQAALLGERYQARLFINDYWQLAIKHRCYGVHLGQEDLDTTDLEAIEQAGLRLGVSTHSEYEWLRAISIKPSYVAMGTVYPTQTKPAILIGLANLHMWCQTLATDYPIVAIGGIKLTNISPVVASGAGSIAVVTAITLADDYQQATAQLTDKIQPQHTN